MKTSITQGQQATRGVRRIACIAALDMALTFALPFAAHAQVPTPPPVPDNIRVLPPDQVFLVGRGVGTQNYECQPSPTIGQVAWTLFTPQATLFNDQSEQLITHFFSPNPEEVGTPVRVTWEDSRNTSTVWAKLVASASVTPGAIAWLKLQVVGTRQGPTGGDTFSGTTFIQRLNTVGGLAPTTDCALPTDIGNKAFIPYTADYFFYRSQ
jgi:hypothetical protein